MPPSPVVTFRCPPRVREALDAKVGKRERSAYITKLLARDLGVTLTTPGAAGQREVTPNFKRTS